MSRLDLPNPGPGPKTKNDDSVQARPFKMGRFGSPQRRLPPVLAPLRGPGQQSRRHSATQTRPWSAIPKTRRHPRDTPTSNPQDTAPPRQRLCLQQSPRHGATHVTRPAAMPMAQRHPDDALISNPEDTAPPGRRPGQQSSRHGAAHATMAQRRTRDTPSSNPHGTAAPTRHAQQQSPWHSATHATRPAAIPMAQPHARCTRDVPETQIPTAERRPHDLPSSNPHGTAPHTAHARRARNADPNGTELTTHPGSKQRARDAPATRPRRAAANEANTFQPPDPDYKREPFATHSGKNILPWPGVCGPASATGLVGAPGNTQIWFKSRPLHCFVPRFRVCFLGCLALNYRRPKNGTFDSSRNPSFRCCTRAEEHSMHRCSPSMVHAHAQFAERNTINIQSRVPSAWAMWTSFRNRTRWCTCIETSDCGPLPVAESPKTG